MVASSSIPPPSAFSSLQGAEATRRVALASVSCALFLAALKFGGWLASGSVSLLATLADSALDILAAAGTLTAVRLAGAPPDEEHRYGHGKAEAFATLLQSALVFASAALIAREAVGRLLHPEPVRAEIGAMLIMVVSTALALLLVVFQTRVLRTARSVAVEGDRTHYLADVASNLVALAGLGVAALLNAPWADAAAALVVVALLAWGAIGMLKAAADNLMDRELDEDERKLIVDLLYQDPEVLDVRDLRTRASGPIVHIQAHVALDPDYTVETAHSILVRVERLLLERMPAADILLQPDPHGRAEPHAGLFAEAVREREAQR